MMKILLSETGAPFLYALLNIFIWGLVSYPYIYGLLILFFTCLEISLNAYKKQNSNINYERNQNAEQEEEE